jgi:hypothetical protein
VGFNPGVGSGAASVEAGRKWMCPAIKIGVR